MEVLHLNWLMQYEKIVINLLNEIAKGMFRNYNKHRKVH